MKVAICDDCPIERENTKHILQCARPTWKFVAYESGEDLVEAFDNGFRCDIIFLDIFMRDMNGMEAAHMLRKMNFHTAIVFLTSSIDYAIESYDVNAFSYLLKPINEEKMLALLKRFEEDYRPRQILLGNKLFATDDILFFESKDKKVLIFLKDGTHEIITAKLGDVEQSLVGDEFLRCHRSYIINMEAVKKISGGIFIMNSGDEIPIRQQDIALHTQSYYQYYTKI